MKKILLIASDIMELAGFDDSFIKVVSGCGMENAAIAAVKAIYEHRPDIVINVGSAGVRKGVAEIGEVLWIREVYNKDNDLTAYHLAPYAMLGENRTVEHSVKLEAEGYVLASSNSFASESADNLFDVYDMEGYGVAKACEKLKIECHILKGVSDIVGERINLKDYRKTLKQLKESIAAAVIMRFGK